MKLDKIIDLLGCQVLCKKKEWDIDIEVAMASDLMSDVLAFTQPGVILLTGLTNNQVVRTCEIAGISAVVFVRNKKPGNETVQLGEQCEMPLLLTHLSMFDACGILFSEGIKGIAIGG